MVTIASTAMATTDGMQPVVGAETHPPFFLGRMQLHVATTEKNPKHDWCANHYGDEHEHSYSSTNRNRNPEQTIKCIDHQHFDFCIQYWNNT